MTFGKSAGWQHHTRRRARRRLRLPGRRLCLKGKLVDGETRKDNWRDPHATIFPIFMGHEYGHRKLVYAPSTP